MIKDTLLNISRKLKTLDTNFIPANTVITVKQDGTGDFTSLTNAVNSLQGKYSNGTITISLSEGTFVEDTINLTDSLNVNIPRLNITGISTTATKLDFSSSSKVGIHISSFTPIVTIKDLGMKGFSDNTGISVEILSKLELQNIIIDGFQQQLHSETLSYVLIKDGTCTFKNANSAISCHRSRIVTWINNTINFENINTAFVVANGGIINCPSNNIHYTNVNTHATQTVGTATNKGWITGSYI